MIAPFEFMLRWVHTAYSAQQCIIALLLQRLWGQIWGITFGYLGYDTIEVESWIILNLNFRIVTPSSPYDTITLSLRSRLYRDLAKMKMGVILICVQKSNTKYKYGKITSISVSLSSVWRGKPILFLVIEFSIQI